MTTIPAETPACEPAPASDDVEMEENGEPLHDQPGPRLKEETDRELGTKEGGMEKSQSNE